MIREFREFIARGNVVDLAVGIIIGAAFTAIVNSLVNDIVNPPLGLLLSGVDFRTIVIPIGTNPAGEAVTINIGAFLSAVLQFLITALVVFLLIRTINRLQRPPEKKEDPAPVLPDPTPEQKLTEAVDRLTVVLERMEKNQ